MIFYDRLTWMYILQLNYWRGPIDARTLYQNIGAPGSTPLHKCTLQTDKSDVSICAYNAMLS